MARRRDDGGRGVGPAVVPRARQPRDEEGDAAEHLAQRQEDEHPRDDDDRVEAPLLEDEGAQDPQRPRAKDKVKHDLRGRKARGTWARCARSNLLSNMTLGAPGAGPAAPGARPSAGVVAAGRWAARARTSEIQNLFGPISGSRLKPMSYSGSLWGM